jgi:VWFA-related protein
MGEARQNAILRYLGPLVILIGLGYAANAAAQDAKPGANAADAASMPLKPTASDGSITLSVVVTPKAGAPVQGLQQNDFTLLEDGAPQTISAFHAVTGREAPIETLIVIDLVNNSDTNVGYARDEVEKFLKSEGGSLAHPVALVMFTDSGLQVLGNYSTDGNALAAELSDTGTSSRFIRRSSGFYGAS